MPNVRFGSGVRDDQSSTLAEFEQPLAALPGTFQVSATSFPERMQIPQRFILTQEHVSEVDLMSAIYPLSIQRRIERRWAERINSLRQTQIGAGTERTPQRVFNHEDLVIPVPLRTIADRRQPDRSRPRD